MNVLLNIFMKTVQVVASAVFNINNSMSNLNEPKVFLKRLRFRSNLAPVVFVFRLCQIPRANLRYIQQTKLEVKLLVIAPLLVISAWSSDHRTLEAEVNNNTIFTGTDNRRQSQEYALHSFLWSRLTRLSNPIYLFLRFPFTLRN